MGVTETARVNAARFGELPRGWKVTTLGEIAGVSAGGTPSRAVRAYWGGDIPWVTTSQVDFNTIYEAEQHISELGLQHSAAKVLPPGCVLMALYGQGKTRGKVAILGVPAATNQACAAIVAKPDVSSEYLFHFLASRYDEIRSKSNIGNQDNLNGAIVRSIEVVLPPLAEQQSIASALNDADELVDAFDVLIEKKRAMRLGVIQRLLSGKTRLPGFTGAWQLRRLGDVLSLLSTANNPRADLAEEGDVIYIHYGDVHAHMSPLLDCTSTALPRIDRGKVDRIPWMRDGDLLLVDASEDLEGVGKSVEIQNLRGNEAVAGLHTILCRGDDARWAPGFKAYLQFMPELRKALDRLATGTSVYGISKRHLSDIEVALPAVDEQAAIAAALSDIEREIATLADRRRKVADIKLGMQSELLAGRRSTRQVVSGE